MSVGAVGHVAAVGAGGRHASRAGRGRGRGSGAAARIARAISKLEARALDAVRDDLPGQHGPFGVAREGVLDALEIVGRGDEVVVEEDHHVGAARRLGLEGAVALRGAAAARRRRGGRVARPASGRVDVALRPERRPPRGRAAASGRSRCESVLARTAFAIGGDDDDDEPHVSHCPIRYGEATRQGAPATLRLRAQAGEPIGRRLVLRAIAIDRKDEVRAACPVAVAEIAKISGGTDAVAPIAILVGAMLLGLGYPLRAPVVVRVLRVAGLRLHGDRDTDRARRLDLLLYVPLAGLLMLRPSSGARSGATSAGVPAALDADRRADAAASTRVASAFILPRLFAGETTVFVPLGGKIVGDRASAGVRQHQPVRLLHHRRLRVLCGGEPACPRRTLRAAPDRLLRLRGASTPRSALIDLAGKASGAGDLLGALPHRGILDADRGAVEGFWRITGGYPEASTFGGAQPDRAGVHLQLLARHEPAAGARCFRCVILVLLLLCTSSTGYAGLAVLVRLLLGALLMPGGCSWGGSARAISRRCSPARSPWPSCSACDLQSKGGARSDPAADRGNAGQQVDLGLGRRAVLLECQELDGVPRHLRARHRPRQFAGVEFGDCDPVAVRGVRGGS